MKSKLPNGVGPLVEWGPKKQESNSESGSDAGNGKSEK